MNLRLSERVACLSDRSNVQRGVGVAVGRWPRASTRWGIEIDSTTFFARQHIFYMITLKNYRFGPGTHTK